MNSNYELKLAFFVSLLKENRQMRPTLRISNEQISL